MSKREVLHFPHSVLRKECEKIESIDDEIVRIARDMAETMYVDKGIGLAAPQIGIAKQLIVVDIGEGLITLINPEVEIVEGSGTMEEGCLCLPQISVDVERNACARVSGLDLQGTPLTFDAEDLLARVFQHEIDHLHGTLIIDKLSKIKRDLIINKYKKLNQKSGDS